MKFLIPIIPTAIAMLGAIVPIRVAAQQPLSPNARQLLNCLSNYPQTPAEGNQPITRYEFAIGLDACLNEVTAPLSQGNFARKTELNQLIQRQQELNQELRLLREQVDATDAPSPVQ